ncbi:MAG: sigma-70 family RNA polymerase sigma factor [Flavobacteriales bacterium]|nr:sigma-70 family RNA polymerase sigma factor [Flavobacteriales bacterium]
MLLRRKTVSAATDEELVLALRGGHRSALGDLWDRYAHLLYGVGMKYLKDPEQARDAVTELFEALSGLVAQHDVERFRPWVHTVMRNRCLMELRKRTTTRTGSTDLLEASAEDGEEDQLHEATLQQLERAMDTLNAAQRTCIQYFHLERKSYQQTAALTGFSIDQVRSHLQNGRRNLGIQLKRHADQNA